MDKLHSTIKTTFAGDLPRWDAGPMPPLEKIEIPKVDFTSAIGDVRDTFFNRYPIACAIARVEEKLQKIYVWASTSEELHRLGAEVVKISDEIRGRVGHLPRPSIEWSHIRAVAVSFTTDIIQPTITRAVQTQSFKDAILIACGLGSLFIVEKALQLTATIVTYMFGTAAYIITWNRSEARRKAKERSTLYDVREYGSVVWNNGYVKLIRKAYFLSKIWMTSVMGICLGEAIVTGLVGGGYDYGYDLSSLVMTSIKKAMYHTPGGFYESIKMAVHYPHVVFGWLPFWFAIYNMFLMYNLRKKGNVDIKITNIVNNYVGGDKPPSSSSRIDWYEKSVLLGDYSGYSALLHWVREKVGKWKTVGPDFSPPKILYRPPDPVINHRTWNSIGLLVAVPVFATKVVLDFAYISLLVMSLPFLKRDTFRRSAM